jgi:multiple sugar transport system ATP-binding protein
MGSLTFNHVKKKYGNNPNTVEDFHLEVMDKEFLVLVGPSGCGKSTTLRMIAGLEEITEGELYIGDRLVNDVAPKDRDIAMVFQNYALYPHMNVYENMAFGLKMRKFPKPEIEKRVREAAKILDIEHLLDRKPKALSGGQRQRVALGRAIVRNSKVFLMDEPLSNLDAKLRVQMRTEISKLHKRLETTMVYVTHDQTEAMTMGDRIVVMYDGVIQQVASPQEIYQNPANKFVAGFIGSPAMNFMEGRLNQEDGRVYFTNDALKIRVPADRVKVLEQSGYIGKEIILGIRPEDIHNEPIFLEASPDTSFRVPIEVVENMGAEWFLYFMVDSVQVTARLKAITEYRRGERIQLALDMNKSHFFDKKTEKAIR